MSKKGRHLVFGSFTGNIEIKHGFLMTTEQVVRVESAIWCMFGERKAPRKGIHILSTYRRPTIEPV